MALRSIVLESVLALHRRIVEAKETSLGAAKDLRFFTQMVKWKRRVSSRRF